MKVTLTAANQELARELAREEYEQCRQRGRRHRWNRGDDHTLEKELDAKGAEAAVAQHMGVEWTPTGGSDPEGDVLPGVQVRHTRYSTGRLLLHAEDRDEHIFYLVTGRFPEYEVVGWISGRRGKLEGKQVELQPGRPCIAVEPQQLQEAT